jgi:hypothetical protein
VRVALLLVVPGEFVEDTVFVEDTLHDAAAVRCDGAARQQGVRPVQVRMLLGSRVSYVGVW